MSKMTRFTLLIACLITIAAAATGPSSNFKRSRPRWEWWPNPGPLADGGDTGAYLNLSSGVSLWYTTFGVMNSNHTPVLLLHGGEGNSNQMYYQANALAKTRRVILQDTRGEGRSPYANFTEFHYDDFTTDAIAVLDHLNISKVAVVGWSDGAITGLDLAMNFSSRIERVFAHGANLQANMSIPGTNDPIINSKGESLSSDFSSHGITLSTHGNVQKRTTLQSREDDPFTCRRLSPLPQRCPAMVRGVEKMWDTEPVWGTKAMGLIKCPVWVVDGDHDIDVYRNQPDTIAAWIPFAGQLILPQVGHAALLEDHKFFNFAVEYFLDMAYDGVLPYY